MYIMSTIYVFDEEYITHNVYDAFFEQRYMKCYETKKYSYVLWELGKSVYESKKMLGCV